jgi:hypothetical protein
MVSGFEKILIRMQSVQKGIPTQSRKMSLICSSELAKGTNP